MFGNFQKQMGHGTFKNFQKRGQLVHPNFENFRPENFLPMSLCYRNF